MFYRPSDGHGLPHDPFNAIVSPRPIAWISSQNAKGRGNLAPYSFFTAVAYHPPQIVVSSVGRKAGRDEGKDTLSNIRETGVFCVNIAGFADAQKVNASSAAFGPEVDEAAHLDIPMLPCSEIAGRRIATAPASLECRLQQVVDLAGAENHLIVATVVAVHIDDACLTAEGRFDITRYRPLARLGYFDFAQIESVFPLPRPKLPE